MILGPGHGGRHDTACDRFGAEELLSTYMFLDLTPKGRNETGRGNLMDWVKRHDEYEDATDAGSRRP